MNKFALVLIAAVASVLGTGVTASAYPPDYPPAFGTVTLEPAMPAAGELFTVTFEGCVGDETVSFGFAGRGAAGLLTDICENGRASVQYTAPTLPGTYSGGITALLSNLTGSFEVVIVGAGLPTTGSDGASTLVVIAFGLLATGGGLFSVSRVRRLHLD